MKISHRWLLRYLDASPSPAEVAERITLSGFPVDHVVPVEVSDGVDHQLDVEVTWNRPDCQCHVGVAREVAGLLGTELVLPIGSVDVADVGDLEVTNSATDLCPLYTARIVRGVRVGPSPQWLVDLLTAAGQRSVNNVVDVTNFVMLETGQPLHAFDLDRLDGSRLGARRAEDEAFVAIDGSEHRLGEGDLAIVDGSGPVALAGILGGRDSEVDEGTADLVLEAALFDSVAVRSASRRHGLASESSFRFERHVDPDGVLTASDRAAALFVELCGAQAVGPVVAAGAQEQDSAREIALRTAQVRRVFGVPVEEHEIRSQLRALGLHEVACEEAGVTRWRIPRRRPDLTREIDLVEEVVRRVGFERVPEHVAIPVRPLELDDELETALRVRDTLVAEGLLECRTAPFVAPGATDPALFTDRPALMVENPVRSEEHLLRRSLLGGLLQVAQGNRERGNPTFRLFEQAPVYLRCDTGSRELQLTSAVATTDYAELKGTLEAVLGAVGLDGRVRWRGGAPAPFHGDRSASLSLDDEPLGWIGELRPGVADRFSLPHPSAAFELDLGPIFTAGSLAIHYRPVSRFPVVQRDLAWVVPESVTWGAIEACVRGVVGDLLTDLTPFDVYRGGGVPEGAKSVAFRMELRPRAATFTGAELESLAARVVAALARATGGRLRE